MMPTTANNHLVKLKAALRMAYEDGHIKENIANFRHTFATLQLAGGTDIYTVSKLLTHSNLATTQVYADVVSELKRDASERISLKTLPRKMPLQKKTKNEIRRRYTCSLILLTLTKRQPHMEQNENNLSFDQLPKAVGELLTKVDYVISRLDEKKIQKYQQGMSR